MELKIERFTSNLGITDYPSISPDGRIVAYASDREADGNLDIFVQHISLGQPNRLTHHEDADYEPSFSPDGSQIVERHSDCILIPANLHQEYSYCSSTST